MQTSKERSQEQMKKKTLGMMISSLRKENGMTQLELAEKMGVTDKAVSKWERDLSCPDVNTIPKLAEIFNISVDELMQVKADSQSADIRFTLPRKGGSLYPTVRFTISRIMFRNTSCPRPSTVIPWN